MKHAKKLASLLLALVMVFALTMPALAQDVGTAADDKGTITISNAAKGETYQIYKLFDATVSADGKHIAYTGTIPDDLETYFLADANGYISATDAAKDGDGMSEGLRAALKTWVATATKTADAVSDGSALNFKGLDYGYYVVTTTQGEQLISVDSTMRNATIVDKNSSTPSNLVKSVGNDNVNIGDTVTYTVSFKTSNYDGAGTGAKKIISYTITDTLPEFLSDVAVTSIIVDNDGNGTTTDDRTTITDKQFENKKITIDWYNTASSAFLYDNGATVTITYTAKVTDAAAIDGAGNTNKVTVTWTTEGNTPSTGKLEEEETIFTYAIALKKVNEKGESLSGAVFELPFYVKETVDTDGAYIYAGNATSAGLTKQLTTPEGGEIIIKGVQTGTYTIKEVTAPDGYNKLLADVAVTAAKTGETTTSKTFLLDENGNVVDTATATTKEVKFENNISAAVVLVVNKAGTELPSTGGMGTTIFYVVGSILLVGAAVLLITKRRMSAAQ